MAYLSFLRSTLLRWTTALRKPRTPHHTTSAWRWAGRLVVVCLLAMLSLGCGAWWAAAQPWSLAWTAQQASRWLPPSTHLTVENASASLLHGGTIGTVRWQAPSNRVELQNLTVRWNLARLWDRHAWIEQLSAQVLHIQTTPAAPDTPAQPPASWQLPVQVTSPIHIGQLRIARAGSDAPVEINNLQAQYQFDGQQHRLQLKNATFAQGEYRADITVHALPPMAVQAQISATVTTALAAMNTPVQVRLTSQLQGRMDSATSPWQWQAKAQSQVPAPPSSPGVTTAPSPPAAVHADLQATLLPWATQPLVQAQADFRGINLSSWWPAWPVTALSGTAKITPASANENSTETAPSSSASLAAINVQMHLNNAAPGPWDTHHLPVASLQSSAYFDGQLLRIAPSRISPATQAGSMELQGQWTKDTGALSAQLQLEQLAPQALHTALQTAPLNGSVRMSTLPTTAAAPSPLGMPDIDFGIDISASTAQPKRPRIALQQLRAQGQWHQHHDHGTLTLRNLKIDALQATLASRQLELSGLAAMLGEPAWPQQLRAIHGQGDLQASIPGAQASITGQLGHQQGQGQLQLQIQQPSSTQQWLETIQAYADQLSVPIAVQPWLLHSTIAGQANLQAQWKGGWDSLAQALISSSSGASRAPALDLHAQLSIPEWRMTAPPPSQHTAAESSPPALVRNGLLIRATSLRMDATAQRVEGSIQSQVSLGQGNAATHWQLQSRLSGQQHALGQWQGQLHELQMKVQLPRQPGRQTDWQMALTQATPFSAQFQAANNNGSTTLTRATLGQGQLRATGPATGAVTIGWQPAFWQQPAQGPAQWATQGTLRDLPLAWLDALGMPAPQTASSATSTNAPKGPLAQWGLGGDVVLNADWNASFDKTLQARASIQRAHGDLRLYYGAIDSLPDSIKSAYNGTPAGLSQAQIAVEIQQNTLKTSIQWRSQQAGEVTAQLQTTMPAQPWWTPSPTGAGTGASNAPPAAQPPAIDWSSWLAHTPLIGHINARLPDIGIWSALAPPGWRIRGTLATDLRLSGNLHAPQWRGNISADALAMRSIADGLDLHDGQLRATLEGSQLRINTFTLRGGSGSSVRILGPSGNRTNASKDGGTLSGTGTVAWGAAPSSTSSGISMNIQAQAQRLKILVRADRQASVSGDLRLQLQKGQWDILGKLSVDRASIALPDETAPTLGSDVVVHSRQPHPLAPPAPTTVSEAQARSQASPSTAPRISIDLDLGDDFALQGHGITTRLAGQLNIRSSPNTSTPKITGEIHTVQGQYRAWGQILNIETGIAQFNGTYDNPSLNILALRSSTSERVGVHITGGAQQPRIQLYADPVRPDAEILSLLVLGRSSANGGLQAGLLQQAAMALLGGKAKGASNQLASRLGLDDIGVVGLASGDEANNAALSVGKRISKDLYITYEQGLTSTLGTLYIFYELSRQLTLRGQTGARDAVDIVYTMRYD